MTPSPVFMLREEILEFYSTLKEVNKDNFDGFPKDWELANPYKKYWNRFKFFVDNYYHDDSPRDLIIALNPGRKGCSRTGIALTDEKTLKTKLGCPESILNLKEERPEEENTAQRVYPIIEEVFSGDMDKFFSRYFLTNVFPFGITNKKRNNVNFKQLIKIESINDFSNKFISDSIKLFKLDKSKRLLCVGRGSEDFIGKKFKKFIPKYLPHPSPLNRNWSMDDIKKEWRHTLR